MVLFVISQSESVPNGCAALRNEKTSTIFETVVKQLSNHKTERKYDKKVFGAVRRFTDTEDQIITVQMNEFMNNLKDFHEIKS
jgi:hypothetical protein